MCAAEVDRHVAQRYLLKRQLGKGAYGIVWKAVDCRTGEAVAIKKIFDAFRDKTDAQRTFREVTLLQEFGDHPNIIRLLDVLRAANDRDIYLVFESMDTDLNAVIRKGGLLKDAHKRYIFYQLLQATRFIHSGNVIHRDQKPSNVLLDASCLVKLCDFGLARSLSLLPMGPEGPALTEYVATRWYRAPEVLLSSHRYTPGVDMWSLGCILGEMLRGSPLFPGTSTLHQLELILETIPPPSEEDLQALHLDYSASVLHHLGSRPRQTLAALLPPDTPPEALDLLERLLVFAPDKRLSAAQALQHPYVQRGRGAGAGRRVGGAPRSAALRAGAGPGRGPRGRGGPARGVRLTAAPAAASVAPASPAPSRFRCPARERTLKADVRLPVQEGAQLSAAEYRSRLYQMILERRGNSRIRREEGLRGAPPGDEPRDCRPQAHPSTPRALPQLPAGSPVQTPGPGPQSSREAPFGAKNIPRQKSAPLPQRPPAGGLWREGRPPGATAEAPPWVKPSIRGAVASLASQAVAQVGNQALIRRDRNGTRTRAPSTRKELRPEPRPARRMFTASAAQGVQGAARASLGGYSQAYGTICHSALGRLPLHRGART